MALGRDVVDAIIREHAYRPITGDVLLIGQQAITLSRDEVLELMREHDVVAAARDLQAAAGDKQNVASADSGGMSAAAFFALLGIDRLHMLDIAHARARSYFSEPLPDRLKAGTDFIIDGGALTDIFSPAAVLRNYARALRPGGRLDRRQQSQRPLRSLFDPDRVLVSRLLRDQRVRRLQGLCSRLSARPAGPSVLPRHRLPAGSGTRDQGLFVAARNRRHPVCRKRRGFDHRRNADPRPSALGRRVAALSAKPRPDQALDRARTWCAPASNRANSTFAAAIFSCARIIPRSIRLHWCCAPTIPRSRRRHCRRCRRKPPVRHRRRS